MSSPFAELERQLEAIPISRTQIEQLLEKMAHDLDTAEYNRKKAPDWVVKMAHETILSGCTALMAAYGYRSKVNGHHYVTLRFAQLALPMHKAILDQAERLRRRRHQVTYTTTYAVSEEEAVRALELTYHLAPLLKEASLKALAISEIKQRPEDRRRQTQ
jgi:PII-like signaling protein